MGAERAGARTTRCPRGARDPDGTSTRSAAGAGASDRGPAGSIGIGVAQALEKPAWWGALMAVPGVNLVAVGLLAWG